METVGTSADKDSGDEKEKSASYHTGDPSAGMAAQAYKDIQHRVPPMNRRPERRSLDKSDKVVTTPDSGAKVKWRRCCRSWMPRVVHSISPG